MELFSPKRDEGNLYTLLISRTQLRLCLSELPFLWCSDPSSSTGESTAEHISCLYFSEVHSKVKYPSSQLLTLTNLPGTTTEGKTLSTAMRQNGTWRAKLPHHTSCRTDRCQISIYQQGKSVVAASEALHHGLVTPCCPWGGQQRPKIVVIFVMGQWSVI